MNVTHASLFYIVFIHKRHIHSDSLFLSLSVSPSLSRIPILSHSLMFLLFFPFSISQSLFLSLSPSLPLFLVFSLPSTLSLCLSLSFAFFRPVSPFLPRNVSSYSLGLPTADYLEDQGEGNSSIFSTDSNAAQDADSWTYTKDDFQALDKYILEDTWDPQSDSLQDLDLQEQFMPIKYGEVLVCVCVYLSVCLCLSLHMCLEFVIWNENGLIMCFNVQTRSIRPSLIFPAALTSLAWSEHYLFIHSGPPSRPASSTYRRLYYMSAILIDSFIQKKF